MRKKCFLLTIVLAFSLLMATGASAAFVTYYLNESNVLSAPPLGYYATVKVEWDTISNFADITFQAAPTYKLKSVGLNVVGSFEVDSLSSGYVVATNPPVNLDGFELFNLGLNYGGSGLGNMMVRIENLNPSDPWDSVSEILFFNSTGDYLYPAAAHVVPPSGETGWAAGIGTTAPPPHVPIPAAAWLLGTGLIGLALIRRRTKK